MTPLTQIKLNTNKTMVSGKRKICSLCKQRSNDLTNHYVTKHKCESYISRLSDKKIEKLKSNPVYAKSLSGGRHSLNCIFCMDTIEDVFENFYQHLSMHTGEYACKCSTCNIVKPFPEDVVSHQKHI